MNVLIFSPRIAAYYHHSRSRYCDEVLKDELSEGLELLLTVPSILSKTPVIVIAGDFNTPDTDLLEASLRNLRLVDG